MSNAATSTQTAAFECDGCGADSAKPLCATCCALCVDCGRGEWVGELVSGWCIWCARAARNIDGYEISGGAL